MRSEENQERMVSQKPQRDVFGRSCDTRDKGDDDRPAEKRAPNCVSSRESIGDPEECCPDGMEGARP